MAITVAVLASGQIDGTGFDLALPSVSWDAGDILVVPATSRHGGASPDITSVSATGLTFTRAGQIKPATGDGRAELSAALFYAVAASSGSSAVTVTTTLDWGYPTTAAVIRLRGADTASPLRGAVYTDSENGARNPALAVTTQPGDVVIEALSYRVGSALASAAGGQTQAYHQRAASTWNDAGALAYVVADGTSESMAWTRDNAEWWVQIAAVFKPAAASTPTSITWDPTDAADTPSAIEASIGATETVVIEDQSGNPVAGVGVTSADTAVFTVSPATTLADGLVTIAPVGPGTANLTGSYSGLTSAVAAVTVPTEGSGGGDIPTAVPPTITTTSPLPAKTVGDDGDVQIAITGDGPYTLDVEAGTLPPWLALPSGMPLASPITLPGGAVTGAGQTWNFTLRATGPDGAQDSKAFAISAQAAAPTVSGVTISPAGPINIGNGATQQLTATVQGTGNPAQTVTWSKTSGVGSINASGLVSGGTTGGTGVFRATSTVDTSKFAEVTINVAAAAATVSGVTISPSGPFTWANGAAAVQLSASVQGTNSPAQSVTWSKTGPATVNGSGLVTPGTTAGSGTITATSTVDTSKSATVNYTVQAAAPAGTRQATITGLTRTPAGSSQAVVAANLTGIRCAVCDATWPQSGAQVHALVTIATNAQGTATIAGLPSSTPASAVAVLRYTTGGVDYAALVPITTQAA